MSGQFKDFSCKCDECGEPVPPRDSYAVTWTEWSAQDQRHIKHLYPGNFHGGCTAKAKERLDREKCQRFIPRPAGDEKREGEG